MGFATVPLREVEVKFVLTFSCYHIKSDILTLKRPGKFKR